MSDRSVVLDASALLALLLGEPGAERVATAMPGAVVGAVNLSEVVAKLCERGMPIDAIRSTLAGLDLDIHSFDAELAFATGELRGATRGQGLSLGDRACLALAARLAAVALTTDRAWADAATPGAVVELIR